VSGTRPAVVKIGGTALAGGALDDLSGLLAADPPTPVALVHGGGKQLTRMLEALRIPTEFREGLRVTDEATMAVAEMVFAGEVNKALVRELYALGIPAVGVSGTDGPTLLVEPIPCLGRVGNVTRVDGHLVETLWSGGSCPSWPGGAGTRGGVQRQRRLGGGGRSRWASARGTCSFLTDVDGLLVSGDAVAALAPEECEGYVERGLAVGGMVPKLRAAAEAARGGVRPGSSTATRRARSPGQ
jgi:acetylglutamate kinase